jgi:hypothetical protein
MWPSGIHQTLNDVHTDQFLEVKEPEAGAPEEQNRKPSQ